MPSRAGWMCCRPPARLQTPESHYTETMASAAGLVGSTVRRGPRPCDRASERWRADAQSRATKAIMAEPGVSMNWDVIVVGGGVIGLSVAWELSRHGVSVCVVDRQQPGREASWAGAGLLPPGNLEVDLGPEQRLRAFSAALWREWVAGLFDASGVDSGYRESGAVEVADEEVSLTDTAAAYADERIAVHWLRGREVQRIEKGLAPEIGQALWVPSFCQVRNPHHLRALHVACARAGVAIIPDRAAVRWDVERGRIRSVELAGGERIAAERYV
ncbi:MAG: FAD-dependent oxidoreductase, partial [Planctomycetota bacterium]